MKAAASSPVLRLTRTGRFLVILPRGGGVHRRRLLGLAGRALVLVLLAYLLLRT